MGTVVISIRIDSMGSYSGMLSHQGVELFDRIRRHVLVGNVCHWSTGRLSGFKSSCQDQCLFVSLCLCVISLEL
ncbi:rCG27615 [Rattus norvegicus]|uniref:RCG27615 n=1 Tax=Rattus norvegicus TaxID=10116 RepID=A6KC01_RAT|nr:rCG27615 [Rattus norvegicus]